MTASDDSNPGPDDVIVLARAAGLVIDRVVATRIANSIGPALRGFHAVEGSLPFDLEPAAFVNVQNGTRP